MKKVLFYLLLFICSFSTATFAQSYRRVSEKEALYIAQKQFTGKDVDYSTSVALYQKTTRFLSA